MAFRGRGNSRGRGRGRGAARSGIRTRGGFRKTFDSQRIKDVESDSEDAGAEQPEQELSEESEELSSEEEEADEGTSGARSYNALLQSFQQSNTQDRRQRKRRKLDVPDRAASPESQSEAEGELGAVEGEDESIPHDVEDEEEVEELPHDVAIGQEDEEGASDPYEIHFAPKDDNELARRLKAATNNHWRQEKQIAGESTVAVAVPEPASGAITRKLMYRKANDFSLKQKLIDPAKKHVGSFNNIQQALAPYAANYADVLVANRTPQNAGSLRSLACLHALNHILKGRDKVLKNTARLARAPDDEDLELRDQGFTRPKVLLLTETRQMASKYAEEIVALFSPEQQENKQRFKDSFSAPTDDRDTMPEDYLELFDGNNDNSFMTGLKFTRKTLKYFSAFYTSDIIVASPLGLRRILEHEDVRKRDHDFLSSIELCIVDQADAMQMQNWENVEVVFKHLNLQPKDAHGADFSRIRHFYLNDQARHFRQTLIFSAYTTPEITHLFNNLQNHSGRARITPSSTPGALTSTSQLSLNLKQTLTRFPSPSPSTDPDSRFKYFTTAILPTLLRLPKPADNAPGILLFIPSYFDFLRLRNFFATSPTTSHVSFGTIHDYTSVPDQRRARSHFLSGRHSFLLYTQRAHHFFRLKLRGVKRVVCYALPDNPVFYEELVGGFLGTSLSEGRVSAEEAGARALFSKWDGLKLERVVGSERVRSLVVGQGDVYEFV
ncbi:hypothetical protein MBLNU230_g1556t1 [Neophaeotheca triangularis]